MELNSETALVVTGGAGFIGSNFIREVNDLGVNKIIIVDSFVNNPEKWRNLIGLDYHTVSDIKAFYGLFANEEMDLSPIKCFIHLGGRADTRADMDTVHNLNYMSSINYLSLCAELNIPMYYASSAATYGNTDLFIDNIDLLNMLEPNNAYGMSKHMFDLLVMRQDVMREICCGMKFFNVYGPGEMHKGNMASIIGRILNTDDYLALYHVDGWERDFIYVEDVVNIIIHFIKNDTRGLINVGSGVASSWEDIYNSLIKIDPDLGDYLNLIKNPKTLPDFFNTDYQRYSKADISKLRDSGYKKKISSLTDGIKRYKNAL